MGGELSMRAWRGEGGGEEVEDRNPQPVIKTVLSLLKY